MSPEGGLDRATLVVAGVATLGLIMAVLDTTIVNVALDTLSRDLHAGLGTVQWTPAGHVFVWSAGLMVLTLGPAIALARADRAPLAAVSRDRAAR